MPEIGYFHESCGYWQTTNVPPADVVAGYPSGTIQVPLKPGSDYYWSGSAWLRSATPAATIEEYRIAIDALVEATAKAKQYNSAATCASYISSSNTVWAAEAAAFIAWRDAVWVQAFTLFAAVQAAEIETPTVAEVLVALPEIVWPD